MRNEIINESKSRIENINNLNQCIESDITKLNDDIKNEVNERENFD